MADKKVGTTAAIIAAEILYADLDMEHEVLVSSIIASTIAYGVYGVIHGWEPIFILQTVQFTNVVELLPYTVLAVVLAIGTYAFVGALQLAKRNIGQRESIPNWLRPAPRRPV